MPSDLVWLLKERAVTHLRVFYWFSSKPGARCELLVVVITLNQKKTISGFGSTPTNLTERQRRVDVLTCRRDSVPLRGTCRWDL